MTKYLLDTDTCIFYLKNKYGIADKIKACGPGSCLVSEITIAELLFGAHNSGSFEHHAEDHIKILSVAVLQRMLPSLDLYGKEKARLRKTGIPLPEFDLLIGTTAVYHDLTLVTNNTKHMSRINGIKLENWTQAEDNAFVG